MAASLTTFCNQAQVSAENIHRYPERKLGCFPESVNGVVIY